MGDFEMINSLHAKNNFTTIQSTENDYAQSTLSQFVVPQIPLGPPRKARKKSKQKQKQLILNQIYQNQELDTNQKQRLIDQIKEVSQKIDGFGGSQKGSRRSSKSRKSANQALNYLNNFYDKKTINTNDYDSTSNRSLQTQKNLV